MYQSGCHCPGPPHHRPEGTSSPHHLVETGTIINSIIPILQIRQWRSGRNWIWTQVIWLQKHELNTLVPVPLTCKANAPIALMAGRSLYADKLSPVVLNQVQSGPGGTFGKIYKHFWPWRWVLAACREQRPGPVLSEHPSMHRTVLCAAKNHPVQNVNRAVWWRSPH